MKEKTRGPSPTGIQQKSLGIPNGIWNLDLKSGIFGKVEISENCDKLRVFQYN